MLEVGMKAPGFTLPDKDGRPVSLSALTRLSFGAEPRPDSPAVIKSNKIFSICHAAKKGGTLELSPDVNIILSGGLE